MSIEPSKKKKVEKDAEGKPFVFHNDLFTKASGAPDAKINGIGTMEVEPDIKPDPHEPTPPKDFNQLLRDAFERAFTPTGYGFGVRADGPMRMDSRHQEEDPTIIKVSLEEALRREFELCKTGRFSIGYHVTRSLEYIRQYIDNTNKRM